MQVLPLEKRRNLSLLKLHNSVTDKNDPYLYDVADIYYLNEQVKPIKKWGPQNLVWQSISLISVSWETRDNDS